MDGKDVLARSVAIRLWEGVIKWPRLQWAKEKLDLASVRQRLGAGQLTRNGCVIGTKISLQIFRQHVVNTKPYEANRDDLGAVIGYIGKLCFVKRPMVKLAVDAEFINLLRTVSNGLKGPKVGNNLRSWHSMYGC